MGGPFSFLRARSARVLRATGPLALPLVLAGGWVLLFGLFRLGFLVLYWARLRAVPELGRLPSLGLRFDLITCAYLLAPLALALLAAPAAWRARLRPGLVAYGTALSVAVLFLELASLGFLDEYDSRPNRLFLEHALDGEVLRTIWRQYPLLVCATVPALALLGWAVAHGLARLERARADWNGTRRALALPVVALALFLAGRGSVLGRATTRSVANVSTSHLANELVPNSSYTLACAFFDLYLERSPAELYGDMPFDEALARVRRWSRIEDRPGPVPLLHEQRSAPAPGRPMNLVIVLEESLGAQFVGALGGLPLTPELERLGHEGLWFENLYCTGTRTVRGLEAMVCGFLPTPSASVLKLGLAQQGFLTIAALLKSQGYATEYVYGGDSGFDNMENFLLANGFDRARDQDDFAAPEFVGTWGVSDEDLMREADALFASHGEQPFFALVLSTSNHAPFEYPPGRIRPHDAEPATRNNAVQYADYAIGRLFERARTEEYFAHTLWIVVADHDTRAPSDELLPLEHFHIPGLILGPNVDPRVFVPVASQVDLLPTALHLLGYHGAHPLPGRDLLELPSDDPGRAVLQYYTVHGFLAGDRLVVHAPYDEPLQFTWRGGHLAPAPLDRELERDALAHALLPWRLYLEQKYRLP